MTCWYACLWGGGHSSPLKTTTWEASPDATREAIFARVREVRELYSPKKIKGLLVVYPVMASLTFPGIAMGMDISNIGVKTNIKYRLHLKIRL